MRLIVPETAHGGVKAIAKHFSTDHLAPRLRPVADRVARVAQEMINDGDLDGPELTAGLRKLLEAKDCFVRAAL